MAVKSKMARFQKDLERLERSRQKHTDYEMKPRQKIRIRLRCRLCGRPRANYRKFGICRICFRNMASEGLIPGVKKSSW